MDGQMLLIYLGVFIAVLLPVIVAQMWRSGGDASSDSAFDAPFTPKLYQLAKTPISLFCAAGIGESIAQLRPQRVKLLMRKIIIANLSITPQMIFSAQVFYALILIVMTFLWCALMGMKTNYVVMSCMIAAFIGWVYPATSIESLADKRQSEIIRSLPFAIDLIGSAMRSGLDFGAAIRYYVTLGGQGALSMEFNMMLKQIELGKTRVEALGNMAGRINTPEFTSFVGAVAHGTEIGASIVDTMCIQGEELRRARFNLAERKAARAPSLMILPMAIFIMPAVFIIIFTPVYLKVQASGMGNMFGR